MSCRNKGLLTRCRVRRLLNDPDDAVDESLRGIAMINSGLIIFDTCKALLRRDYDNIQNKVKLISGGGAGNEPTHSGFVGPGMLTAAVFGNIYTAPSSESILKVIEELGINHSAGILLIVQNYIGYRLNFALAKSRAENEGLLVRMIVVKDDSSFTESENVERRGLLGTLFIHKIAGAMAEEKKSLDEICNICETIIMNDDIASIGICMKIPLLCTDVRRTKQIEIGYGIHGESGVFHIDFTTTCELVSILLNTLLKTEKDGNLKDNFQVGHEIAVIISNLGGCSQLEMNIFIMEVIQQLSNFGLKIERIYAGNLMTALNNNGFHISLLNLSSNANLLQYLDAPTMAPAWPKIFSAQHLGLDLKNDLRKITTNGKNIQDREEKRMSGIQIKGPIFEDRIAQVFLTIVTFACEAVIACTDQIDIMDEDSGDGDCGTTLSRGAKAIKAAIKEKYILASRPSVALAQISHIIERSMGGLQGGLYSIFFYAAAQAFEKSPETEKIDAFLWSKAFTAANKAVSEISGSKEGDRTMLDPLLAAQYTFSELLNSKCHPIQAFGQAVSAAETRAIQTTFMSAAVGRASMIKSKKFEYPDPGAHAVGIWMRATYEGIKLKFSCQYETIYDS